MVSVRDDMLSLDDDSAAIPIENVSVVASRRRITVWLLVMMEEV